MTAKAKVRGHDVEFLNGLWVYSDTKQSVANTHQDRGCGYCGLMETPEGHDACLGTLNGIMNACCGHGVTKEAYAQLLDGTCVRGNDAKVLFDILKRAE